MTTSNCGAPTQFLRMGFKQRGLGVNGIFKLSALSVSDGVEPTGPNLLIPATLLVDNVAGVYEVAGGNVDGSELVDKDPNTFIEVNIVNVATPNPWYVNVDFGAGNEKGILRIDLTLVETHRPETSDWELWVYVSDDNTTWQLVEVVRLLPGRDGINNPIILSGRGDDRNRPARRSSGEGFIPGIVSEDSVIKRNARVFCYERDTMLHVSSALTDENGNYTIYGLDTEKSYLVMAVDDDGAPMKQPSVWDHVIPTPGYKRTAMHAQTWQNRVKISDWKINLLHMPGLNYPHENTTIGGAEFNWDFVYGEDPLEAGYGGFTEPTWKSASAFPPLRADQPAVHMSTLTQDRGQSLKLSQMGDCLQTKGIAVEVVTGLTNTLNPCVVCIRGAGMGKLPRWDQYVSADRGVFSALTSTYRTPGETLYLLLHEDKVRYVFRTSVLGRIDRTKTLNVSLNDGLLHHFVGIVVPGEAFRLYVDGVLVEEHSLLGTGVLVNEKFYNGDAYNEAGLEAMMGMVDVMQTPNPSDYNHIYGTALYSTHLALLATYAGALTEAQVEDLYDESIGAYPDVELLPGVTGYEAEVLADAPNFYWPMQDMAANVSREHPPIVYPNPERVVLLEDPGHEQSTFLDLAGDGSLETGMPRPGTNRLSYKLNTLKSSALKFNMLAGTGLSNTRDRTLEVWTETSAAPAVPHTVLGGYVDIGDIHKRPTPRYMFHARLNPDRTFTLDYQIASTVNTPIPIPFSYILPIGTQVHVAFRFVAAQGRVHLLINGVLVEEQPFTGYLLFGAVHRMVTAVYADANTPSIYIHDVALYDYALTDERLQVHYNAGV